ncbi:polysaccharide deacetylase family protein [Parasulfuritortus cantonensis]|uniref:Polysaccharide deacetylase family protein n=1 Tax=Parasulfuritortus cantonensis TaxID=2528202 RepID=A0A4R1BFG5_9PROT|nr:polysaccharide deacetylase family protein [Parasulfuritortus cantonensis]TCJ15778.1 polysaccharide deacetylase family protein [Parasulfuritortus cantonensis]
MTEAGRPVPSAGRWRPTPFLLASAAIHVGALAGVLVESDNWPYALAVVLLDQLAITAAGLWPRSTLLGANLVRLHAAARHRREVALTFDDGPDPAVTPRVLDILQRYGARATFFCIGERAAAHPDICRAIVAAGHRIENHGQRHRNHAAFYGVGGWRREVAEGQDTLERLTGRRPCYFRALAGLRNPFLDPVLTRLGLRLATWTRRAFDTRCGDPDVVLARLTRKLAAGDILLLHDGHSAPTGNGNPVVLEVLPRLLAELAARGLHAVHLDQPCLAAPAAERSGVTPHQPS